MRGLNQRQRERALTFIEQRLYNEILAEMKFNFDLIERGRSVTGDQARRAAYLAMRDVGRRHGLEASQ